MKNILALFVFLLCVGPILAQITPAPTPTPVSTPASPCNLAVGTEYIKFSNGMQGTMVEALRPITDCNSTTAKGVWSIGYAQVMVPAANRSYYLLGPRYDISLDKLIKTKSSGLPLSKIRLFAGGGLGTAHDNPANAAATTHFAYGAHGGISVSPGSLFGAAIQFSIQGGFIGAGKQVLHAATIPQNAGQYAAGVNLVF